MNHNIIAYAEINNVVIALFEGVRTIVQFRRGNSEAYYYVSFFNNLKEAKKCKYPESSKKMTFEQASKRFAKLCKASQTMTFKQNELKTT